MRVGLLGEKLSHSFSPIIHNYIYKELSINLSYELFEVNQDNILNFKNYMLANDIFAVNITIPYKKVFLDNVDCLSESVKKINSMNLLYIKDGRFYADNTDYEGFNYTLIKNNIDVKGKIVYIMGNGGAALTVRKVLEDLGAKKIVNIFRENKKSPIIFDTENMGDILINTTPLGMYPNTHQKFVPDNFLANFKIAIDLIYNPIETELLKSAKELGLKTINGVSMLIEQAIRTDEIIFSKNFNEKTKEKLRKNLEIELEKIF